MLLVVDGVFQLRAVDLRHTLAHADAVGEVSQMLSFCLFLFYRPLKQWKALLLKSAIPVGVLHQQPCRLCAHTPH